MARIGLGWALSFVAAPALAAPPAASPPAASSPTTETGHEAESSDAVAARRAGLRARAGAFGLAHARSADAEARGSMGFAPGVALGLQYSLRSWDLGVEARGAYMRRTTGFGFVRETHFFTLGARARWFTAPDASLTAFVNLGADAMALDVEGAYGGLAPSAHLGAGAEVLHDSAHGRLAFELAIDAPLLPMHRAGRDTFDDRLSGDDTRFYVVPVTLAANWTF